VRADDLDLPVPLDRVAYRRALETLEGRGLIKGFRLTEYGREVEVLPVDRPWGELLVQSDPELIPIIATIIDRYRRTASQTIEFRQEGTVPSLEADPIRISQVVENLISNACKYSLPESTIVVTVADHTDKVEIIVSDDGEGIEPSKLPRIFERFYRAKEGNTEVKGTGLGLYITREIVQMHGGTIEVESKRGAGTTFTVRIPIRMHA
ncbi:MAG: ATP-binding protein, partial [Acidobacteria bacterium]|nr:ATP-binding protein [Acidobacteriota bacterium]